MMHSVGCIVFLNKCPFPSPTFLRSYTRNAQNTKCMNSNMQFYVELLSYHLSGTKPQCGFLMNIEKLYFTFLHLKNGGKSLNLSFYIKKYSCCSYISAMLSGRLAGMAVRPFPLQSTMLLLQVHMAGQEPPPVLHGCKLEVSWCPGEKIKTEKKKI